MSSLRQSKSVVAARTSTAFTLIEVLVVVAIIALLISILLPSLRLAREQGKSAVCLSSLQQQGRAFSAYSADYRGFLPRSGSQFKYTVQEGTQGQGGDWTGVGAGALYGRYITKSISLLYCPSNGKFNAKSLSHKPPLTNEALFRHNYLHPKTGTPGYNSTNDTGFHVANNYLYAVPAAGGQYPRDAGKDAYRDIMSVVVIENGKQVTKQSNYYKYMIDPADQSPADAAAFLGAFPPGTRGKSNVQALSADGYCGGLTSWHPEGLNVLYTDFHAKRVADPKKRFVKGGTSINSYSPGDISRDNGGRARGFIVWDYLSRNP